MTHESDDRLRGALRSAVPQPPAAPDRVERAAAAGRRRRLAQRGGAALAALSVLAIAVGVPMSVDRAGSPSEVADSVAPTPSDDKLTAADVRCPPPSGGPDWPEAASQGGPLVPEGVVAARICDASSGRADLWTALPWRAPNIVLTQHTDELVTAINQLSGVSQVDTYTDGCPAIGGSSFDLVLRYPDRRDIVITGSTGDCEFVQAVGEYRAGADQVWDAMRHLLYQQRVEQSGPVSVEPAGCPDDPSELTAGWMSISVRGEPAPYPTVATTVCPYTGAGAAAESTDAVLVDHAVVDTEVAEDLRRAINASPRGTLDCTPDQRQPLDVIIFRDEAGGSFPIAVDRTVCGTMTGPTVGGQYASTKARAAIDAALAGG